MRWMFSEVRSSHCLSVNPCGFLKWFSPLIFRYLICTKLKGENAAVNRNSVLVIISVLSTGAKCYPVSLSSRVFAELVKLVFVRILTAILVFQCIMGTGVFLPWLRFDKKAWVNNWKNGQAALEPAAYQSLLHENSSVPTGRATGQKILSQIWDVFAEYTDRGETVLFLLFHLYPDKTIKGHARLGRTAF